MKWRQVTLEETMKYPAVQATIHYHEDKIVWLVPILPDESASLPSLPVTGESEAIEFAEWLSENDAESLGKDHWRFRQNTTHSTAQLYNLYKQSKK